MKESTVVACFLFGLLMFSYKYPERLQKHVGMKQVEPDVGMGNGV
jgi:hypothetical protein